METSVDSSRIRIGVCVSPPLSRAVRRGIQKIALLLSIAWIPGCKPVSTKPDFVMELKGYCPDDDTRTRVRTAITAGLGKLRDPDLKQFLATAQIEDNIPFPLGTCQEEGCACPDRNYVVGVWRNDIVPTADRVAALTALGNTVPPGQSFSVSVDGLFLRDAITYKWLVIPKRYSRSTRKPAADGAIELLDYSVDYPSANEMRLGVTGLFHEYNDPHFSLAATDRVSLTAAQLPRVGLIHSVLCTTDRHVDADVSIIEGMSWFLVPFAIERQENGGGQIEDILGITRALGDARNMLPMGAGCAAASVLPSEVSIPKLSPTANTALKIIFDYGEPNLDQEGLFAFGSLVFAVREPSVAAGFPNGEAGVTLTGAWYDIFVHADQYAARTAKSPIRAVATDMRDPTFTWTIQPVTWSASTITLTGANQSLTLPIGNEAQPGEVGYAYVWVTATDKDGLVAKANLALRARIATCCDTDMFHLYFNLGCARKVGVNREQCANMVAFPDPEGE